MVGPVRQSVPRTLGGASSLPAEFNTTPTRYGAYAAFYRWVRTPQAQYHHLPGDRAGACTEHDVADQANPSQRFQETFETRKH
jgi:hypothetical protein